VQPRNAFHYLGACGWSKDCWKGGVVELSVTISDIFLIVAEFLM